MRGQPRTLVLVLLCAMLAPIGARAQEDADLVAPPLPAAPSRTLTLAQAMAIADRGSPDLEILRLQVGRSEAAERIAWAGVLPVITGTLTYQRYGQAIERAGVGVVRGEDQFSAQLSIVETLSMRTVSAVRIAEAVSDVNRLSLEDARRLAHGSIARVYYVVLAAQRAAELTRTQIDDAVRQYEAMRVRQEVGTVVGLDVARAEVAALDAVRRSADADAALERAWDQLGAALGLDEPAGVADAAPPSVPGELEEAIAQRSDVRAAQAGREVAGRAVDDAWFRFAPSLSFSWVGTLSYPTTLFNPDPAQWVAAVSLNVPIYDGGVRYGALADAQLQLAQADERLDATLRRARVEMRDAVRRISIAERNLRIAERQAEVARRAAAAAEASYAEGNLSGLELDAARRGAEQAELNRILAELELSTARVDALTSSGEL